MAVRHGYGKASGADALVFAYDTGDTKNSYKGEPTTNLLPNGTATGHNSGGYGNVVTVTDATSEKGPGWKKVTISNRGSNFRIIQWTYANMSANVNYCHSIEFDWGNMRGKGYYIVFDGNGTGTGNYYRAGDYSNTGSTSIDSTMPDGKFAGTIVHTSSHTHAFFIDNNTTGVSGLNDYFYYKNYQVEVGTHPTPYTAGTRSATQGLLDLISNNGLDLTDTTFNSSAEVDFDGTNGLMYSPELPVLDSFTLDVVFKPDTVGGWMLYRNNSMNYASNADNFTLGFTSGKLYGVVEYDPSGADVSVVGTSNIATSQYSHGVFTYDNPTRTLKIYVNGELENTTVHSGDNYPYRSTKKMSIGADGGSNHGGVGGNKYFFNGQIPVTKVYNRALTAAEVLNNFNNYKSRFNL